jgi:dTDP-4-dehydrorhamnose reductase
MQSSNNFNFKPEKTFVLGANGFIGSYFLRKYRSFYPDCMGSSHRDDEQPTKINLIEPDIRHLNLRSKGYKSALICAAVTKVDTCENNPNESSAINVEGTLQIIKQLYDENIYPIYLSSDYVFDGNTGSYTDESPVNPVNVYGRHKAAVEKAIPQICGSNYTILRLSKVYSTDYCTPSFLSGMISDIASGRIVKAAYDQIFCPTLIEDLLRITLEIQAKKLNGLFNVCSPQAISRYELAKKIALYCKVDHDTIIRISIDDLNENFRRPHNTSMICNNITNTINARFTSIDDCILMLAQNRSINHGKK